ncbi:MAG: class I SAM-dependent methyltransferase [Actinomycetota bacterium]
MTTARTNAWMTDGPYAENYQRELVPVLFKPWARDLVADADLRPGERLLDLACGTGIVARTAAQKANLKAVTGIDVNADMLAVARSESVSTRPPIAWRLADATDTGLPTGSIDVALCQQGLQFFPDRPAALTELHRVVNPGGRIAVSVWANPDSPGYVGFTPAFRRHLPDLPQAVGFVRAIFSLTDPAELYELLVAAGFHDVRITCRTHMVRCVSVAHWVTTFMTAAPAPGLATVTRPIRDRIVADMTPALTEYVGPEGLAFPLTAHIATARR